MTYLLDAMVVSYFLRAGRRKELAVAAVHAPMAIVDEVRGELENDKARGGAPFRTWLASTSIAVIPIEVGSPASVTFAALRDPVTPTRDAGERASIALAAADPSLSLVTHDKAGAWLAMRELWAGDRRQLVGLAPFLRRLVDVGAVSDASVIDDVVALAMAPAQRPTWWPSWRASLSASLAAGPDPAPAR